MLLEHDDDYCPTDLDRFVAEERATSAAADDFARAIERDDERAFLKAARRLHEFDDAWNYAFTRIVRDQLRASQTIRRFFLNVLAWDGGLIRRCAYGDDLLADALRLIVGGYRGPSLRLFRGQDLADYKRGKLGVCWTTKRRIASLFGDVTLEAVAPTGAIISAVRSSTHRGEYLHEHLVDPRMVRIVGAAHRTGITPRHRFCFGDMLHSPAVGDPRQCPQIPRPPT